LRRNDRASLGKTHRGRLIMDHSPISPSGADRWVNCPGSVPMAVEYPEPDRDQVEADEGRAAHLLAEAMMERTDAVLPDDPAMVEAARMYAEDVGETRYPNLGIANSQTELASGAERKVRAEWVHPELYGTADYFLVLNEYLGHDQYHKRLIIWDFKYGFKTVEAVGNWQGISYAAGFLAEFPDIETVEIRIIQPRAPQVGGQYRKWSVTVEELKAKYFPRLAAAAAEALVAIPAPRLFAGSHCRYCPAAHGCAALQASALSYIDAVHVAQRNDLDTESLSRELDALTDAAEVIKYRKAALEAMAESELKAGKLLNGWHLQPKAGSLKWLVDADVVIQYGEMAGVNLKKISTLTPTQAKAKGLNLTGIAKRGAGSLKLAKDNNKTIKQMFEGN